MKLHEIQRNSAEKRQLLFNIKENVPSYDSIEFEESHTALLYSDNLNAQQTFKNNRKDLSVWIVVILKIDVSRNLKL